jgi:hypothetical protein
VFNYTVQPRPPLCARNTPDSAVLPSLRLERVITAATLSVIRSVILTPVTLQPPPRPRFPGCSASPKTRKQQTRFFPVIATAPAQLSVTLSFSHSWRSLFLFRNRALVEEIDPSVAALFDAFRTLYDSPRVVFRVLPEAFPAIPGSPGVVRQVHLHIRLPRD